MAGIDHVSRPTVGIVVAGGRGNRMGFPKQYALLAGEPMWTWSVEALVRACCRRVILVVPQADVDRVKVDLSKYPWSSWCEVVAGGENRADSVRNGMVRAMAFAQSSERGDGTHAGWLVLVHDAARPFVSTEDIQRVIDKASTSGAAILATACRDTVKRAGSDGAVLTTLNREELWLAQTPQVFLLPLLFDSYQKWRESFPPTDEAQVVEAAGHDVHVVPTTGMNLKITTPTDLEYAAWYAVQVRSGGWGTDRSHHEGERLWR